MNKEIMKAIGFEKEVQDVENKICPCCKKHCTVEIFRDKQSEKEFKLSGLCQSCQDDICYMKAK